MISYLVFNLFYDFSINNIFYIIGTIISSFLLFKQVNKNQIYKSRVIKFKITKMKLKKEILNTVEYPIIMLGLNSDFSFKNHSYMKFNNQLNYKDKNSIFFEMMNTQGNNLVQSIQSLIDENEQEIIRKSELFLHKRRESEINKETPFMINLIKRKFNAFNEVGIVVVIKNIENEIKIGNLQRNIEFTNLMLYSISHEFRTPLNGINGVIHLLKSNISIEFYKYLDLGKSCLTLLNNQIHCLLDYAHIIKGEFSLHESIFNVSDLLHKVKKTFQKWMLEKKTQIEILLVLPNNFPNKIFGDYERIIQILLNLILNSVKYTERGFIKLSAFFSNQDLVEFHVEDSGNGFSKSQILTLNNFNFDSINSTVIGFKNFPGFKLSIVQMILYKMHSRLKAEERVIGSHLSFQIPQNNDNILKNQSKINSSLDFIENINIPVSLLFQKYNKIKPKHTMKELKCKRSKSCNNLTLNMKKILIVDDVESNRFVISEMILNIKPLPILQASNGLEAIRIAEIETESKNDLLIFMDVEMPVMDGFESTSKIRKFSQCPIIILTAYASEDIRIQSEKVGANKFMTKPITFSQLKSILSDFGYL